MASCTNCGSYTKYENGLCYDCYKEKKGDTVITAEAETVTGLTDREYEFRYNMIKGRIAETLIQELFLSMKYNVFRYGMENTIPGIMDLLKGVKTDVAQTIKRMPDFVIQNPRNADVHFVEVKFRASEKLTLKDVGHDYPWLNSYFIIVSKKHIKCISYKELQEGKEITPSSKNYLGSRKEFDLDKETIIDFCEFAVKFFEGV